MTEKWWRKHLHIHRWKDHYGYLTGLASFSTSAQSSNPVNSTPAGLQTPQWTPQSNMLEALVYLVHKTLETLVQCITMKAKEEIIWRFWKIKTDWDRPNRFLNCLYWLKTSSGEKVWVGAMTTATLAEQTLTALEVHTLTWFSQMKLAAVQTAISNCP